MPTPTSRTRREQLLLLLLAVVLAGAVAAATLVRPGTSPGTLLDRLAAGTTAVPAGGSDDAATGARLPPVPDSAAPAGYTHLAFADEFGGTRLDGRKWRDSRDGHVSGAYNPDKENAYYDPANVHVAGGQLHLTLRAAPGSEVWGHDYAWSSGAVTTEDRFTLGDDSYVAARVKLPTSDGLWPAFWTAVPHHWPPETDIFEFFSTARQSRPKFDYHPAGGGHVGARSYGEADVDYRQGWHTYGLLRQDGVLTPYLDGVAQPQVSVAGADTLQHYLVLNLALYSGHQPAAGSTLSVDWVRVWTA